MKPLYQDILDLASYPPTWYDQNGTPRYCEFHPDSASNIYALEVVLLKIQCQSCRQFFLVEMHSDSQSRIKLSGAFDDNCPAVIHYGDPPRHENCLGAGETMNSDPFRIMEFWRKNAKWEWERVKEYEVYLVE